jgi:hypothetical protein
MGMRRQGIAPGDEGRKGDAQGGWQIALKIPSSGEALWRLRVTGAILMIVSAIGWFVHE